MYEVLDQPDTEGHVKMFKCTVIKREMPSFEVRGLLGLIYKLIFTVFFLSFNLAPSHTHAAH